MVDHLVEEEGRQCNYGVPCVRCAVGSHTTAVLHALFSHIVIESQPQLQRKSKIRARVCVILQYAYVSFVSV